MATPICTHVREYFKAMRNPVVNLFLVWICFRVRLAYTLCDDLRVAFSVACIFAVRALHASRVLQELSAESATHNVVELLEHKLMAI